MPPMNPMLLQALARMGGGPGGPPGGMMPGGPGGPPPPFGGPGGPPPPGGGMPPGGPQPPGPISSALGQEGLDALNDLIHGQSAPEVKVDRVNNGLEIVHQILNALIPVVGIKSLELSKQLYTVGRQVADVRINLNKQYEEENAPPPESMIGGISGTGLPGVR